MNKKSVVVLLSILAVHTCLHQAVEPSSGIGSNILQIEMEGQYANELEAASTISSWLVPNTLLRYGITNSIELQLNVPYFGERLTDGNDAVYVLHRFDNIKMGTSINLWPQKRWIPETALMVRAILPISDLALNNIGEILALNFSNQLNNKWSLNYNLGYIHEVAHTHSAYYILNIWFEPNSNWHFYIENTGEFNQGEKIYELVNGGFGINITDNFCTDFSFGKGINKNTYYMGLIISWAIDTKKV